MRNGEMMGPPGRECNGDGTCLPAVLHSRGVKCKCGSGSWDHDTNKADEAYCLWCGEAYEGDGDDQRKTD